jgi:hypothetical protein
MKVIPDVGALGLQLAVLHRLHFVASNVFFRRVLGGLFVGSHLHKIHLS